MSPKRKSLDEKVPRAVLDDDRFQELVERLGITEQELIDWMVDRGWEIGRSSSGNEFWPPEGR